MIKDVKLVKEIIVAVDNKVGVLANMSKILADHDINIEGVAGYAEDGKAKIMIITDDNLRASDALKKAGYANPAEREAVAVDLVNKPGALKNITARLASEKIDIKYVYGTICSEGCPARIVFSTTNNEKAFVLFKSK